MHFIVFLFIKQRVAAFSKISFALQHLKRGVEKYFLWVRDERERRKTVEICNTIYDIFFLHRSDDRRRFHAHLTVVTKASKHGDDIFNCKVLVSALGACKPDHLTLAAAPRRAAPLGPRLCSAAPR